MSAESPGQKTGFRAFLTNALRPKKSRQVLRKNTASTPNLRAAARPSIASDEVPEVPSIAPLQAHRLKYREKHALVDTQLGETRDPTAMLHSIGILDTEDSDGFASDLQKENRPPGEPMIASLSQDLWALVAEYLNPAERASLAFASKTLLLRLGRGPWMALNFPENREYRIDFLVPHDRYLPHHLLCMPCARYHRRTQEGHERLEPATVVNPLFNCPNARNPLLPAPRHRITHARMLHFTFVQLALRAHRFGPAYGIPVDSLSRRWRRDGWSHHSRYHIHKGKLLMRVVSSTFADPDLAPSSMRLLLYSREDYWPYFSVCAHWRDGELMDVCKCALGHVPKPRATAGLQGLEHRAKDIYHGRTYNPNEFATLCAKCRPMRRCPDCPSEYMVEIKLSEDRSDPRSLRFRHGIVVTRWCDLGDGSSPHGSREWAACNGELAAYDSFEVLGKRSISGVFESAFTDDHIPGQRIVSMNPKGKKLGEAGNSWY
ncbi:hypothetical protein CNMCM6805_005618 [Aspergillus fumigatiaffinis]|uniref:Uncharacterized protein n=1 Tax=Aspergillus fumigatiaffinis TaxID=340414 RepID=A0A8H4ME86_9EURO|nr:hypothetical protein CNMCM5878_007812 [Aspergillus fumigatiaffinis]KAF4222758.1 hypothetical protein CNMCM6457_001200 [Aspergillus fumigatiaffinis]KAF4239733.1 hypothetical protein CNMCM6805_005618 [Aspergillus fumigatiaffinis]